jgi:hypothetical protein
MSMYTASEAASVCGVSLRTVQRKIPLLEAAGAYKDGAGAWRIPVAAMRAAGLSPGRLAPPDAGGDTVVRQRDSDVHTLSLLREQVSELRRRAEVAEALAAERERVLFERDRVIEVQSRALLMLENRPVPARSESVGAIGRALRRLMP